MFTRHVNANCQTTLPFKMCITNVTITFSPATTNISISPSGAGNSTQPSAAQLRTLVVQIQMAVSAGYLNHQILNQPLAPQTLVLLNQLLQQVNSLKFTVGLLVLAKKV